MKWDKGELPEDANSARVQHQRKRELHRISQPALGKGTKQMSVCNKQDIRRVLSVHVVLVDRADLLNEIIKTVRHLLRRPVLTWSDILHRRRLHLNPKVFLFLKKKKKGKTYSPFSQPSLQISHSLSVSKPCSFLKARISLVNRPSYKP